MSVGLFAPNSVLTRCVVVFIPRVGIVLSVGQAQEGGGGGSTTALLFPPFGGGPGGGGGGGLTPPSSSYSICGIFFGNDFASIIFFWRFGPTVGEILSEEGGIAISCVYPV